MNAVPHTGYLLVCLFFKGEFPFFLAATIYDYHVLHFQLLLNVNWQCLCISTQSFIVHFGCNCCCCLGLYSCCCCYSSCYCLSLVTVLVSLFLLFCCWCCECSVVISPGPGRPSPDVACFICTILLLHMHENVHTRWRFFLTSFSHTAED